MTSHRKRILYFATGFFLTFVAVLLTPMHDVSWCVGILGIMAAVKGIV